MFEGFKWKDLLKIELYVSSLIMEREAPVSSSIRRSLSCTLTEREIGLGLLLPVTENMEYTWLSLGVESDNDVQFSDWAVPIVPVTKSDGSIHICGDYKLTSNTVAKLDTYLLPRIEDLYAALSGGKVFFKTRFSSCISAAPPG